MSLSEREQRILAEIESHLRLRRPPVLWRAWARVRRRNPRRPARRPAGRPSGRPRLSRWLAAGGLLALAVAVAVTVATLAVTAAMLLVPTVARDIADTPGTSPWAAARSP